MYIDIRERGELTQVFGQPYDQDGTVIKIGSVKMTDYTPTSETYLVRSYKYPGHTETFVGSRDGAVARAIDIATGSDPRPARV